MTEEKAERLVELLLKVVKLQRLIKIATGEQYDAFMSAAERVVSALVEEYDADRTWVESLIMFGAGQYYGQDTVYWVGDAMSEQTAEDALRREVYSRNGLELKHEYEELKTSQDRYAERGALGKLPPAQQEAYNFYHAEGSWPADKAKAFNEKYPGGLPKGMTMADAELEFGVK